MNSSLSYSEWEPEPVRPMRVGMGGLTCKCTGTKSITNDGGKHQKCYTCGQEWHAGVGVVDRIKQPLQTPEYKPYNDLTSPFKKRLNDTQGITHYDIQLTCGHDNICVSKDGKRHQECLTCGQEWHAPPDNK